MPKEVSGHRVPSLAKNSVGPGFCGLTVSLQIRG